jgi:hypothetical protein
MPQRRKRTATTLQRIAKLNPQVDKKLVEESLALVASVRDMGFKGRGYDILGSSESRLRVKPPVLSKL